LRIGPLPARFTRTAPGHYHADWPPLPVTGSWRLTITLGPAAAAQTRLPIH
jgi:hypothetical protein